MLFCGMTEINGFWTRKILFRTKTITKTNIYAESRPSHMLMCRLPICSKRTGDDTICEHKELPSIGLLMSQKFLNHSKPWTPGVMYQDVPLIASSAACYGNKRSNSLHVAFHSIVCHQEELMMRECQEISGRNIERKAGFRLIHIQSHVKWACDLTPPPQGCRAVWSLGRFTPHVGEEINKWSRCCQFRPRLVKIQPKPALYFLPDPWINPEEQLDSCHTGR